MIIKKLDYQSPKAKVWDASKKKILFTFVDGEYETEDEYIISFWAKLTNNSSVSTNDEHREEKPKKKRGRPAKEK